LNGERWGADLEEEEYEAVEARARRMVYENLETTIGLIAGKMCEKPVTYDRLKRALFLANRKYRKDAGAS
jgi:hypothetical protein